MKTYLILFCLSFGLIVKAQTDVPLNVPGIGHGATVDNTNYRFQYMGFPVAHYGLGWYMEDGGTPVGYLSGYAGLKFFTAGYPRLIINGSGFVGIGTNTPTSLLDIGTATPTITLTPASYPGTYKTTLGTRSGAQSFLIFGNNGQNEIRAGNTGVGGYLDFFTNNTVAQEHESDGNFVMRMAVNGNVGIGTTMPTEKLSVNGKIRAREIKVENTNWPDYVFTKEYQLPTLQQTEQHIKEKGHLPGIPSAEEVKANGIDLGEMNAKLLQKIEELTLYIIGQNKKLEELGQNFQQQISAQQKQIELLNKH